MRNRIYSTELLSEIYPNQATFIADFNFFEDIKAITEQQAKITYFLLLERYANTPIYTQNTDQFKARLFTTIYEYAPLYFKKRELQDQFRLITEEEASKGTKAIYNTANNPNDEPTTDGLEEVTYINSQNTTGYKFSKIETLGRIYQALKGDITEEFLNKFAKLFSACVFPSRVMLYEDDDEEEE